MYSLSLELHIGTIKEEDDDLQWRF